MYRVLLEISQLITDTANAFYLHKSKLCLCGKEFNLLYDCNTDYRGIKLDFVSKIKKKVLKDLVSIIHKISVNPFPNDTFWTPSN